MVGHAYARISTGEILLEETISRNSAGHLSSRTERWFGSERSFAYAYDSRRRLTGVTGAESYGWEYDVSDNMVALGSGETTVSLEYNYSNQLVDDGDAAYVYDADGQLLSQTNHQTEAERSFVYDAVGQLTEVTLEDGRVIRYVLDPAGNPVKRLVDDVLTHAWVYDANRRPIVEYSAALDKHAFVTYGANEYHPAYLTQDGNDYVVVTDSMGNTRGLVDAVDGSWRAAYRYAPYGGLVQEGYFNEAGEEIGQSLLASSFGFAGGIRDADTGMVWLQNRWYMPETGRWNRMDPSLFLSGQWNVYSYAYNNPVNFYRHGWSLGTHSCRLCSWRAGWA